MGVAATLVMWPRPREQTFIPPSHRGAIWNLALISPAVLEKIFENGGWTIAILKLTNEPKASDELEIAELAQKKNRVSQVSRSRYFFF